jgi:hypothetical protein
LMLGVATAAAYLLIGPAALLGLVGFLIWPLFNEFGRLTSISVGGLEVDLSTTLDESLKKISDAPPDRIQEVAAAQIGLLSDFYRTALGQARTSFNWALIGVALGLLFFVGAVVVELSTDAPNAALISAIAGGTVELISGLNFVLYGRATAQLGEFHDRLEQTQRFLLANSMCESLGTDRQDAARASLIETIAQASPRAAS